MLSGPTRAAGHITIYPIVYGLAFIRMSNLDPFRCIERSTTMYPFHVGARPPRTIRYTKLEYRYLICKQFRDPCLAIEQIKNSPESPSYQRQDG
jgi:hypothetical protein